MVAHLEPENEIRNASLNKHVLKIAIAVGIAFRVAEEGYIKVNVNTSFDWISRRKLCLFHNVW